jgi:hypothetical protein
VGPFAQSPGETVRVCPGRTRPEIEGAENATGTPGAVWKDVT